MSSIHRSAGRFLEIVGFTPPIAVFIRWHTRYGPVRGEGHMIDTATTSHNSWKPFGAGFTTQGVLMGTVFLQQYSTR